MKHMARRLLGGMRQPLYAQCYTTPMRTILKPPGAGDREAFNYRSLPPNVSSSAFHTIYRIPQV
jgi:hypothetical protein